MPPGDRVCGRCQFPSETDTERELAAAGPYAGAPSAGPTLPSHPRKPWRLSVNDRRFLRSIRIVGE